MPTNPLDKISLRVEKEITVNEVYFHPTSTASHPTLSDRPSSVSLLRDLRDVATCTIRTTPPLVWRLD
jgi:hypothetical protein